MSQQIFVQTDSRVIDVSKIACMDTSGEGDVLIQFTGGVHQLIPREEADALLNVMSNTRELICRRATITPAPTPALAPANRVPSTEAVMQVSNKVKLQAAALADWSEVDRTNLAALLLHGSLHETGGAVGDASLEDVTGESCPFYVACAHGPYAERLHDAVIEMTADLKAEQDEPSAPTAERIKGFV